MRFLARHSTRLVFIVLAVASLAGWLATRSSLSAAASEKQREKRLVAQNDGEDTKKESQIKTVDIPADTFVIPPNADARQLLKKIHTILQLDPKFTDDADGEKYMTTSRNAIIEAADRLLRVKHSEEEEVEALKSKLVAYQHLVIAHIKDALPKALRFAEHLREDKRPTLAEIGNAAYIDFRMSTIPTADAKDRREIVDLVAASLKRKLRDYFQFAEGLGMMLEQLSDGTTAAIAYEKFGDILSKNLDENVRAAETPSRTSLTVVPACSAATP